MKNNIEILSPVGSFESLKAAVENGANAVYLGGKVFNARQYASNFDNDELKEAVKYAHLNNVKVYVTINILLNDDELKETIDYILFLYNIDVDALIVQDLGLVRLIKELFPDFELHASTQMTINNYNGVNLLEELGFSRVVLARELSVDDINYIHENTNIELEGFIHGALCLSYSGQCLMSSMLGGRSGNRGRCAQPCRMPYTLVDTENNKKINEKFNEKYLLSPKDLNTIDYLEDIISSGITSLKIEGRMKRPEYVAIITDNYKKAVDKILKINNEEVTNKDKDDILQIFNRGFTKGHILHDEFTNFISYDKPNNRGTVLGEVVRIDNRYINILLKNDLRKGDGIEIINDKSENIGLSVDKLYHNGKPVEDLSEGKIAQIDKIRDVNLNSLVLKTSDIELLNRAKNTYINDNEKKIGIYISLEIIQGEKLSLNLWDDNSNYIDVSSDYVPEKALRVSLTEESVYNQINKLGDTPFYIKDLKLNLNENTMVPKSILNSIRRDGVNQLLDKLTNYNKRKFVEKKELINKEKNFFDYKPVTSKNNKKVSVKVNNIDAFKKLNLNKLDRIYLDFKDDLGSALKELQKSDKEVYLSTNKIIENKDFNNLKKTIDKNINDLNGISVSNLGTLKFVKDNYNTNIHCDIGFNIFNSSTINLLKKMNCSSFTLSPELKLSQIKDIVKNTDSLTEVIGYGHLPLMTIKYCPMSIVKKCDKNNCDDCRLKSGYGLLDRKNITFPIERKENNSIIYNSYPIMVLDSINDIYRSNIDIIRLDFTIEKEVEDIQNIYYDYANGKISNDYARRFINEFKKKSEITKGHFYRGVM